MVVGLAFALNALFNFLVGLLVAKFLGPAEFVDEQALLEALTANRIRGAALDVFETEPLPPDNPLWALPNVLISPHSADRTRDSHERAVAFFAHNLSRFERGEPLENTVNKTSGY